MATATPALMRGQAILAIDEGTTGVTALLLGPRRQVLGRAYAEIAQRYPHPGWVEQDAAKIWTTTRAVARAALRSANVAPSQVLAVGVTNQRETTVLWDRKTGTPVAPAIVWQDRRTSSRCAALRPDWQGQVQRATGLVIDPYFSATKLEWLLDRRNLRRRAAAGELAFGTVDSWLAWKMTGRHVTDPTNASRTLLWNIRKGAWDDELLDLFGVPAAVLPEVVPSSHGIGPASGLGFDAPLASLAGDQQSALFGQRCFRAGAAKNTYGTGCFLLQHTGSRAVTSRNRLLTTRAASVDGRAQFALEGAVFTAGAAIQWLRDQLQVIQAASDVDRLAGTVPDAAGAIVVPAFTGLGAPHWDPEARGAILGITRGTDRRHLARAVLESLALQAAQVLWAMEHDSGVRIPSLRVDGGAARSRPLLQFQADLLRRPVVRPANVETTAMGAGMLAGLAVGAWRMRDLEKRDAGDVRFAPRMPAREVKARLAAWDQAVAATRTFKP
jgi:glycerol kinase